MAEKDSLATFDWNKVTGSGLFLKFEAGKPITLRVLTTDPVVQQQEYKDPKTEEITLTTKFNFVVYNFTDEKAQILSASPTIAKRIGELHIDEDFGANIKKIDIKISPTGEKLQRRYDIQVLPQAKTLTNEQIKECQAINLDEKVKDGQRMSFYDPSNYESNAVRQEDPSTEANNTEEEPIDLSDIPF